MNPEQVCRRPASAAWVRQPGHELVMRDARRHLGQDDLVLDERVYRRGGVSRLRVISSLVMAKAPRGDDVIPQWHLSVVRVTPRGAERCSDHELQLVRRAFGLVEAEEDNHHPGNARHLFLPVDPSRRVACECKEDEVQVVEPSGYTWSQDVRALEDPLVCRACEIAPLTGRPCPTHGAP